MTSLLEPNYIHDYQHFEQHVAKLFSKAGWSVETAKNNQPWYDLVVKKDKQIVAVQVKWLRNNVSAPQLLQFANFLDSEEGK
jgi:chromosome partitioning protein